MGGIAETEMAAERTRLPTEEMVASVWARDLQLPHIGLDEDFIALGSELVAGRSCCRTAAGDLGKRPAGCGFSSRAQ